MPDSKGPVSSETTPTIMRITLRVDTYDATNNADPSNATQISSYNLMLPNELGIHLDAWLRTQIGAGKSQTEILQQLGLIPTPEPTFGARQLGDILARKLGTAWDQEGTVLPGPAQHVEQAMRYRTLFVRRNEVCEQEALSILAGALYNEGWRPDVNKVDPPLTGVMDRSTLDLTERYGFTMVPTRDLELAHTLGRVEVIEKPSRPLRDREL